MLAALAFFVGWGGIMHARSVPRYEQLAPGAAAHQGKVTLALTSLTAVTSFSDLLGDLPDLPDASVFVVARLAVLVTTDSASCDVTLIDTYGHRWRAVDVPRDVVSSCYRVPANTPTAMEVVFVVPASSVPQLAGVAMPAQWGAGRTAVVRPPQ